MCLMHEADRLQLGTECGEQKKKRGRVILPAKETTHEEIYLSMLQPPSEKTARSLYRMAAKTGGFILVLLLFSPPSAQGAEEKPHIVVFIADDLGWGDVSFHGSSQIPTPNVDAMAADGIILNSYYVQPYCTPSRAALMTGLYPIRTGMQGVPINAAEPWGLPTNVRILPEYLKELGYQTHLVGKWHLGSYTKSVTPLYRGFDSFYGCHYGEEDYYSHNMTSDNRTGLDFWLNKEPWWPDSGKYSTSLYTRRAQYIIENRPKSKPLMLVMSYQATHSATGPEVFQAPQENVDKFPYIGERNRTVYAGMVDALDQPVGQVFRALGDAAMLENTVIVFSSDNGGAVWGYQKNRGINWPLRGAKTSLWEGGTRAAAFVWSPLLNRKRRVSDQLMHITDWLPTFYSIAGGNSKNLPGLDGHDMWRQLSYGQQSPRSEVLYNYDNIFQNSSALRNSRYKLVLDGTRVYNQRYPIPGNSSQCQDLDKLLAQSTAADVLRKLYKTDRLHFPRDWRRRATLTCGAGNRENFSSSTSVYLFDIVEDPCELNNLASSLPNVVASMKKRMDFYRESAVPTRNKPVDPAGFPEYHNGVWSPWLASPYGGAHASIDCLRCDGNKLLTLQQLLSPTRMLAVYKTCIFQLVLFLFDWRPAEGAKARPHLIFLLADDMGWDDVSFHGSPQIPTPNLDALAADGIILNNYYVLPYCTPSRAALMTGLYPIRTGMQGVPIGAAEPSGLPTNVPLMPQYLKELGYETHLIGKWHLGSYSESVTPTCRGFDTFYGFHNGDEDYYSRNLTFDHHTGLDFWVNKEPLRPEPGRYSTSLYTARAQHIIKNHKSSKPLLLVMSYQAVHAAGGAEPLQAPKYNIDKFPYIGERNRTIYAGMVDAMDESVGQVFRTLGDAGMLENTVIVFSSDNGGALWGNHNSRGVNWPLRGAKGTLWEGGTRAAAFIWSPLLARRRRVSTQLMHITDWLPTFYSLAGGNVAKLVGLDGYDMWRQLSNGQRSPRAELLYNYDYVFANSTALRNSRYKLVLDGTRVFNQRYPAPGGSCQDLDLDELLDQSTAADVLRKLYRRNRLPLSRDWRKKATLTCGRAIKQNFPSNTSVYLFDIAADPCELNDLSNTLPNVVASLKKRIDFYRAAAVPVRNKPTDPAGFPENSNGIWAPWLPPSC
ncbi:uncharacterized protein LOC144124305 [Amblyomma americanum]